MKKIIIFLSVLLIAVLLVGCGSSKSGIKTTTDNNQPAQGVNSGSQTTADETPIDKDIASLDSGTSDDLTSIDSGLDDIGKDLDSL